MPRRPKDVPPPRDPQQVIEDLRRENEQLREDRRRSEIERHRLRRENERLKEELVWRAVARTARRRRARAASPKRIRIGPAAGREPCMAAAPIGGRRRASDLSRPSAPSLSHDDAGLSPSSIAPQVDHLLRAALATCERHAAGTVSDHGLAVARGTYVNHLGALLARRPSRLADARRFATHLTAEYAAVFSLLFDSTLDAKCVAAAIARRAGPTTRTDAGQPLVHRPVTTSHRPALRSHASHRPAKQRPSNYQLSN